MIKQTKEGILLVARLFEEEKDAKDLKDLYAHGHLHFVCKALYKDKLGRTCLLLSPSIIKWKQNGILTAKDCEPKRTK